MNLPVLPSILVEKQVFEIALETPFKITDLK